MTERGHLNGYISSQNPSAHRLARLAHLLGRAAAGDWLEVCGADVQAHQAQDLGPAAEAIELSNRKKQE